MSTNYISPIWRMPRNANNTPVDKLSNYSIEFSGTDYIEIADNILSGLEKFSISVWYNADSLPISPSPTPGNDKAILGAWSSGVTQMLLYWDDNTGWRFLMNDGTSTYAVTWGTAATANTWNHIAITYDGSTISFYHNNGTAVTNPGAGSVRTQTVPWRIGVDTSSTRYWDGKLSQFCLFDYALSTDQRNYLYNLNNPMTISGAEPIAYYPLGDNSNPNANAGYPNISVGADSVFDFNTSGAWIDAGNNPALNVGTGDLSISAWVYPTSLSGNDDVCGIGANGGTRFRLQRRADRIGAYIDSAAGQSSMNGSTSLSINQWYHFVLIKAGVNFSLYLNGNEIAEDTYINSGSFTDTEVAIGQYFGGFGNKWAGELSNIQIWNSSLTTTSPNSDLETLYNNGQPLMTGTQPQEDNLQAWYKLNQSANWEADAANTWQIPDNRSSYPQSFNFDGIDDLITLTKPSSWDDNQVHCVSLWIKNEQSGIGYVINTRGGGTPTPGFSFIVNGTSTGYIFSNTVTSKIATGYQSNLKIPNDGEWHHVLWTHQPITNVLKVYIDGIYKYTFTGTTGTDNTPSIGALIGNSGGAPWKGKISNIMAWEQIVLTDGNPSIGDPALGQVAEVYNNGVPLTTAIATDNLKGWWKLDNTEYLNSQDKWIVDNDAITPFYNNALKFISQSNGSGNPLTIYSGSDGNQPANLTFGASDSFSLSTWYWSETTGSNNYLFTMRGSFATGAKAYNRLTSNYLASNDSQIVGFTLRDDNNVSKGVGSTLATSGHPENGAWTHLAVVVDRTAQTLQMFVNTKGTSTANISSLGGFEMLNAITLGNDPYSSGRYYYKGRQSNFAIFDKALTQSEIETLYNNGTPEENISFSPVSWWKLDNLNTGIEDSAGGGNNITAASWMEVVESSVNASIGVSSGMTEQNLVNNNVSVFNGESNGMTTANLVTSNISRTQPYSNYSFNFDAASSDYFDLGGLQGTALQPSNATLISDGFSVSIWLNVDSVANYGLWQNDGLGQNTNYFGFLLQIQSAGEINMGYGNGGVASAGSRKNYLTTSPQITSANTWYHVVAIYKGIAVTPGLYVNGVEITSFTSSGSATTLAYSAAAKGSIGSVRDTFIPLDGKISNCACFDRTLTQDEVLNIYNNGVPQDLQTTSTFSNNIVAWWPMDEHSSYYDGTDWVIRDIENGNDGDGANTGNVNDLVGNAPGSDANGSGNNLAIADLIGDMKDSNINAYSINMADYADSVTNPANSGRSTEVPSV